MALSAPEHWLRGSLPDIPDLLQPVAHAILQSVDEIENALNGFPVERIWDKPSGVASVGFHLQHIPGVLDRLSTYARGQELSNVQMNYLASEGKTKEGLQIPELLSGLRSATENFIEGLKQFEPSTLTEVREVGRKKLPATVIGLLFHAAEHMMRHTGQLLVTIKILMEDQNENQ